MHHAGPENFEPAAVLADRAALAAADQAVHIDFHAGLGEREMAAAKAHLAVLTEHAAGKGDQDAFEVGHGDVGADSETLNLVEHDLRAGRDRLIAVAHPGQDNANGLRMVRLHGTNLSWRGMRTQYDALIDIKRVP